ncbi:peptidase S13 D-Ala-D-Ala carboxypeptidase C [Rippkaea orientalis PCC 8801]|uniref:Peptidase S13 D-Ala-D-Ala carboxypeptidase C n=1 Tax=Rippkaea orientalis (strain PCC 8801 / RF-1) TaxID=41431 RepID=B7JZK6_RIPO1|nr:D-alanyl-D-alanine carboxypeptidase/D-alanyl-D-alanine-endopeptidase [Rippkaea orientalis]ACK64949.1 peptidase S13 D-Ala-D-Ala carboxypeptidase C [Rippkaea orientalis PCC 8801]
MKFLRSFPHILAIVALATTAWTSPSLGNEINSIPDDTQYLQEEPIDIYVPPPETGAPGTCAALIEPAINKIIGRYQNNWGILAETLEGGTTLYSHNPDKFFIPASNTKLFTTAAALQRLNPQGKIGSKSVQNWINVTNINSNNYYADTLLKHIGGASVAKSILAQIGVDPNSFRLADGSGLSRKNAATPRALVTTLRSMHYAPGNNVFYASLPVAGISGTLRNRMKNTTAQGTVYAKTGTLRGVRALSGYMNHPYFGQVIFSILANNPSVSGSALVSSIDQIVLQISRTKPCN